MEEKYLTSTKSEPIIDIIERMPSRFGIWSTCIIIGLVSLLFFFGWAIQYPDVVTGSIVINAKFSPVKLVANASGKMGLLKFKPKDNIEDGEYIAVIQNPANTTDVIKVKSLLERFDANKTAIVQAYALFPIKTSLGDVNTKYYNFLSALQQLYNYQAKNVFQKQEENLKEQIGQLDNLLKNNKSLEITRERNMGFAKKIADRDSILLVQKVAAEDEADRSKISFLNSKESFQGIHNEITNNQQQIADNENKLQQLYIQKNDKEKQLKLDLLSAYDDLKDNIKAWEQHYVLKSPMDGKLEFLKFWTNQQYVQSGEEVFTVVPKQNNTIGQVQLPAHGAGKVKTGQEVIIKLDNYPYEEYGSIKGRVASISLTTNLVKANNQSNVDAYLINVDLPNSLTTNYGTKLEFKYEIKGTADIISNRRRLIERFFDNLRYSVQKK